MKINPLLFAVIMFGMFFAGLFGARWLDRNLYDWDQININYERLEELEDKAHIYETMTDMNVGIWCELAVHYEWLEPEDVGKAAEIIESGVHE